MFVAGLVEVVRSVRRSTVVHGRPALPVRPGRARKTRRGDIPAWAILFCYFGVTACYVLVSGSLIHWHRGVMIVLCLLGFVYTPLISYVTARLEGMVGQVVEIPMVREASLILSGYKGVAVWFLPIPVATYGGMATFYRQCELLGTKFTSIWKAQFFLYPIILVSSILFANFIWGLAPIPSAVYPYAQKMWDLSAANSCIMYSSTLGEYSQFEQAFRWPYVLCGSGFGLLLFGSLSWLGAPVFLIYGLVRGLGRPCRTACSCRSRARCWDGSISGRNSATCGASIFRFWPPGSRAASA